MLVLVHHYFWTSDLDDIELSGGENFGRSTTRVLKAGICYITEDRKAEGLFFNLPIRPNLTVKILDSCKKWIFLNRSSERQLAHESSKALDVKPSNIETFIGNLSGGNQQKVLIGKGLLTNPKILMLDEPTKGVDIASKAEIYQIVHNLAEKGVGIILVSSEFPELLELSHRVLVFSGGKLHGEVEGKIENEHELMLMAIGGK
jgi:ABC-type sugar transport system ATPase subunit